MPPGSVFRSALSLTCVPTVQHPWLAPSFFTLFVFGVCVCALHNRNFQLVHPSYSHTNICYESITEIKHTENIVKMTSKGKKSKVSLISLVRVFGEPQWIRVIRLFYRNPISFFMERRYKKNKSNKSKLCTSKLTTTLAALTCYMY